MGTQMRENHRLICEHCGKDLNDELVDICQYGYGDNVREYMSCPKCGHRQRIFLTALPVNIPAI